MILAKVSRYKLAVAKTDEQRETHRQEAIPLETMATQNLLREVCAPERYQDGIGLQLKGSR